MPQLGVRFGHPDLPLSVRQGVTSPPQIARCDRADLPYCVGAALLEVDRA